MGNTGLQLSIRLPGELIVRGELWYLSRVVTGDRREGPRWREQCCHHSFQRIVAVAFVFELLSVFEIEGFYNNLLFEM